MATTVAALFDDYDDAQKAMNDLIAAGFTRAEISMVANNSDNRIAAGSRADSAASTGASISSGAVGGAVEGAAIGGAAALAAALATVLLPGVGAIFAVGPIAAALSGAGLGAVGGGIIGGLTGLGLPSEDVDDYAEGIRRGGTLVAVRADSVADADNASTILGRHDAIDLRERGDHYRSTGFEGFRDTANPWTPDQISDERRLMASRRNPTGAAMPLNPPLDTFEGEALPDSDTINTPVSTRVLDDPDELLYEDEIATGGTGSVTGGVINGRAM